MQHNHFNIGLTTYVNIQHNHVYVQHNYDHIGLIIYVNIQHNYVYMQHNCVNMRDNRVACLHNYVACCYE